MLHPQIGMADVPAQKDFPSPVTQHSAPLLLVLAAALRLSHHLTPVPNVPRQIRAGFRSITGARLAQLLEPVQARRTQVLRNEPPETQGFQLGHQLELESQFELRYRPGP